MWVDRIAEATNWEPLRLELPWDTVEEDLGTPLPEDYKHLAATFGTGEFSQFMCVLGVEATGQFDLAHIWRTYLADTPESGPDPVVTPYPLYRPDRPGLIPWAYGEMECEYFWLASADESPTTWPIVTRGDPYDWHELTMPTTEFVHRVLTDPEFAPFSIARLIPRPDFHPIPPTGAALL
ncbi:hypothetical protein OG357_22845 [Streptomyces sp. NBC_01255]|uniref:hypothetical protein n=1 Tax=Streptomyces sp. NBC_01255 TaxID=2903798 RepID=UPI002E32ED67|nr:hypothetical protein [Streptomyces sp. NBC_01255]